MPSVVNEISCTAAWTPGRADIIIQVRRRALDRLEADAHRPVRNPWKPRLGDQQLAVLAAGDRSHLFGPAHRWNGSASRAARFRLYCGPLLHFRPSNGCAARLFHVHVLPAWQPRSSPANANGSAGDGDASMSLFRAAFEYRRMIALCRLTSLDRSSPFVQTFLSTSQQGHEPHAFMSPNSLMCSR